MLMISTRRVNGERQPLTRRRGRGGDPPRDLSLFLRLLPVIPYERPRLDRR
jgi:hypothetical protein